MAKVHAEKYKTQTTWYQKPIEADPDTEQDSIITSLDAPTHDKDFIFVDEMTRNEESVIFIDVQGQGAYLCIIIKNSTFFREINFAKITFVKIISRKKDP